MKKTIALFALSLIISNPALSEEATMSYIDEMDALGIVSGTAMACGSPKYQTFEMLARAILITKAASDDMQEKGMIAYNSAKAKAFVTKQREHLYDCDEINDMFDKQKIFKTTLYRDGTIKMYDGRVFHPRQPYDANLLIEDEDENRADAIELYNKISEKRRHKNQTLPQQPSQAQAAMPENNAVTLPSVAVQSSPVTTGENSGIKHISNPNR